MTSFDLLLFVVVKLAIIPGSDFIFFTKISLLIEIFFGVFTRTGEDSEEDGGDEEEDAIEDVEDLGGEDGSGEEVILIGDDVGHDLDEDEDTEDGDDGEDSDLGRRRWTGKESSSICSIFMDKG